MISDTHGLLRPEVLEYLDDCDLILHAGDIGKVEVVDALSNLAPLRAIRGNVDRGAWAERFPETDIVEVESVRLYVIHDLNALSLDPVAAGFHVVVSGHSHRPRCERRNGVLYVNPGSAGPRRFSLPISLGKLRIDCSGLDYEGHEFLD